MTMATLASGQRFHHFSIVASTVEASLRPCAVRGCFAGDWHSGPSAQVQCPSLIVWSGATSHPRDA